MTKKVYTYKESGVDVEAGERLVDSIKKLTEETHTSGVLNRIGGFGGFFRPDFAGLRDPVLVSSVDGVGTKLKVAFLMKQYDTVGQDLVNHCVNDIAVCGADPLFFLDYFATGKLDQKTAYDVIRGFSTACRENGCALIGGETAEMPDMYADEEFDLAGTIVGVVDRDQIFDGSRVRAGDVLLGFPSTGLHTNGYSLARKVLFSRFKPDDFIDELDDTLGRTLLRIHKSYLPVIRTLKKMDSVHGFAHITGGGLEGNVKRIIPQGLRFEIDWRSWKMPPVFQLIRKTGNVPDEDMRRSFNLGIGLVVVAGPDGYRQIMDWAEKEDEAVVRIGDVRE